LLTIKQLTIQSHYRILVNNLTLHISPGEIVTLMGPSGSGKSTLLSWMIGDLDPYFQPKGELWINGIQRDQLPTEKRRLGILFQDDLLFPHMNVGENLAFALPDTVKGRKTRQKKIETVLEKIGLTGFYLRDPWTLSGGERARVSLMRALLGEPDALLLDEPFSRLDRVLKEHFRQFVYEQVKHFNIPALLVTHDPGDIPDEGTMIELMQEDDDA
jgi:putative thiamine transport system ATP-binding protein